MVPLLGGGLAKGLGVRVSGFGFRFRVEGAPGGGGAWWGSGVVYGVEIHTC